MKPIALASDHAGYRLKEFVKQILEKRNLPYKDYGTSSEEPCDYPDFAGPASRAVSEGESERGILCCGSAAGMVIVANKFPRVRAVACPDAKTAEMSRLHNNANVLALGGRVVSPEEAEHIVKVWLETPFEGGRHARRVEKIAALEQSRTPTS